MPAATYSRFVARVERILNVSHASRMLDWDQQVAMPEAGTPARSRQLAALSAVEHDLLTDPELAGLLDALDEDDLDRDRAANVREMRRRHRRAVRVPTDLIARTRRARSDAFPTWRRAKEEDDFSRFAPTLDDLVGLRREYAAHVDPDRDPYEVLFEEFEPYLDLDAAETALSRLRDALVPLVEAIRSSDADVSTDALTGSFDRETQEALSRDALDLLGYDWSRGRLDTSSHPFSRGSQFDSRVTTRFHDERLLDGLTSTIHEFGHATYVHGIPDEHYGTPLGEPRDMTVHESQSRFWENHVGRSAAFWERFLPVAQERFPSLEDVSPADAYRAANRVPEASLIRVDADELTYHLHIVLRFEVERDLVRGDADAADVPALWNEKMESYLGVRPESDAEGCLQDVHWSNATFGYFPTYSLGSVLAAQFAAALESDLGDLDEVIRRDGFDAVRSWLREHVHRHGCRYGTDDLVRKATGDSFTASHFVEYVERKYGGLYGI